MLLTEYFPLQYNRERLIAEAKENPNGTIRVKAILQRANAKNQNGRIYPRGILEREAKRYDEEFVQQRRALGSIDHPESATVSLATAALNITSMEWQGDDLYGTLEILTTPSGNILRELLKNGIQVGISSRGVGDVTELGDGTVEVGESFSLLAFDAVSSPSTHGAFLHEGVQTKPDVCNSKLECLIRDFLETVV